MVKRRRSFFEDDFFGEFERIQEMMDEFFKEGFREMPSSPLVYGFSMRVDQNGKPRIEEFGNVRGGRVTKEREPLVDVVDLEKEIRVVAELPGVHKEDIHLNAEKDSLLIDVKAPDRLFNKRLKLPAEIIEGKAKASYKNGILEVVLVKKNPAPKRNITVD